MKLTNFVLIFLLGGLLGGALFAFQTATGKPTTASKATASKATASKKRRKKTTPASVAKAAPRPAAAPARTTVAKAAPAPAKPKKRGWVQTWDEPTFAESASGDDPSGEDLTVRAAAIEALGPYNGSIVAVDPTNGRILTIVNQRLALEGGYQPCSTIKVAVALAALREKVIPHTTPIHIFGHNRMDLTNALGYSINLYFANLGIKLGYERVNYYAHLFGYGEKAGLNIPGEQPGFFPPAPPRNGGMGMLTSFGEEIKQTPLELAAIMTSIANGGTLYYMQYPRTPEQVRDLTPQVKRHLDIKDYISDIKPGMEGAVDFGTARSAKQETEIYGKTGTCSEGRTHLGWFGSFEDSGQRKLVVVVMLTGGRPSIGPLAASVAGDVYRQLAADGYFRSESPMLPATILSSRN
jgi:cell division protein FtsI/penicillin-binding protein 2